MANAGCLRCFCHSDTVHLLLFWAATQAAKYCEDAIGARNRPIERASIVKVTPHNLGSLAQKLPASRRFRVARKGAHRPAVGKEMAHGGWALIARRAGNENQSLSLRHKPSLLG